MDTGTNEYTANLTNCAYNLVEGVGDVLENVTPEPPKSWVSPPDEGGGAIAEEGTRQFSKL